MTMRKDLATYHINPFNCYQMKQLQIATYMPPCMHAKALALTYHLIEVVTLLEIRCMHMI